MATKSEIAAQRMADTTFGIEIETVGASRGRVAKAVIDGLATVNIVATCTELTGYAGSDLYKVRMADGREWTVMRDGSLADGGAEIVSPILKQADMPALQAIVRAVRAAGARSRSEDNCGIHVHVGMVNADAVVVARLAKLVARVDDVLRDAIRLDPRRGDYAKKLPEAFVRNVGNPSDATQLRAAWAKHVGGGFYNPSRYDRTRYHGLNLNSWFVRGTAEFRYFNGTLHAGEIRAYVTFCLAMVAKAHAGTVASTPLKVTNGDARHAFYVFLQRHAGLGLKGKDNHAVLHHLTKNLPGTCPDHSAAEAA